MIKDFLKFAASPDLEFRGELWRLFFHLRQATWAESGVQRGLPPVAYQAGEVESIFFRIYQARSQGRESDEGRPGGRAKISENPTFLRIFSE